MMTKYAYVGLAGLLMMPALTADAAVMLNYEAAQSNYTADPGETIDVAVYLRETLTDGSPSIVVNASDPSSSGLFSGAVRGERSSADPNDAAFTTGTTVNPAFDGTVDASVAPDGSAADFYGDSLSAFGPGLLPTNGLIHLGTFKVTAPLVPDVTTMFQLVDYNATPTSIQVLTYEFDELDGLISAGSFSVTSTPEPAGMAGAVLGAMALLRRRRCQR